MNGQLQYKLRLTADASLTIPAARTAGQANAPLASLLLPSTFHSYLSLIHIAGRSLSMGHITTC